MKISCVLGVALLLLAATLALAAGQPDIEKDPACAMCEMNRDKFSHSRAIIEWEDGTTTPLCSINCVVAKLDPPPALKVKRIMVADKDSKELLQADKAFWVVGGDERGVMTREPKWAFASNEGAENFIKKHGGEKVNYEEVMKRARQDIKKRMEKKPEASSGQQMEKMHN
jgi:nitrous oxide reductase accessory protein NosL